MDGHQAGEAAESSSPGLLVDEWFGLPWHVWAYRIAAPGEPEAAVVLDRDGNWAWTGGVFVHTREMPKLTAARHLELPGDGRPPASYRPDRCAPDLLRAAIAVDVTSYESLLGFVSKWGVLGVGLGLKAQTARLVANPSSQPNFDSAWATQRALATLQEHYHWLIALKRRHWSEASVPRALSGNHLLRTARALMPEPDWRALEVDFKGATPALQHLLGMLGTTDPYVSGFSRRQTILWAAHRTREARGHWRNHTTAELHWRAFSISIEPHLRRIHPTIRWKLGDGPMPAWRVRAPIDVLWAEIWNFATRGGQVVRCRYPRCRQWFIRDHGNKFYCSASCSNRERSKHWYETKGRAKRRRGRNKHDAARANVPKNVPASIRKRPTSALRQPTRQRKTPR